jgi:hypothetical protein
VQAEGRPAKLLHAIHRDVCETVIASAPRKRDVMVDISNDLPHELEWLVAVVAQSSGRPRIKARPALAPAGRTSLTWMTGRHPAVE